MARGMFGRYRRVTLTVNEKHRWFYLRNNVNRCCFVEVDAVHDLAHPPEARIEEPGQSASLRQLDGEQVSQAGVSTVRNNSPKFWCLWPGMDLRKGMRNT